MARFVVFFAVWIFLAGCDSPTPIHGTGQAVGPPIGWIEYCERHPDDGACPKQHSPFRD